MIKSLPFILMTAFVLVGCNAFEGQLDVKEQLKFNTKKGQVTVEAGVRDAEISFPNKKEIKLEISVSGSNNNPEVIFKVPKNTQLPKDDGNFELKSKDSGQPYDVVGSVQTDVKESGEIWDREPCTYSEWIRDCYYNQQGKYVCRYFEITRHGYQDVKFYERTEHKKLLFDLRNLEQSRSAAAFNGDAYTTERIYTYKGRCW